MCLFAATALGVAANTALVSGATAAYGVFAQQQGARATFEHQSRIHRLNRELALEDARNQYEQLSERETQERERTAANIDSIGREATRASGLARTAAGESGVTGASVGALEQDIRRQESRGTLAAQRSLTFNARQLEAQRRATRSQTQGRILQTTPDPVNRPDYFGAALRIGGDAYSAYIGAGGTGGLIGG
jgi:hypothetical protein